MWLWLRQQLGLDRPLPVRYVRWVGGLLRGDLGRSLYTNVPVTRELGEKMIRITGSLLAYVFGVHWRLLPVSGYVDPAVVQGVILVLSLIYILINLLIDLSYGLLDPRIRYS